MTIRVKPDRLKWRRKREKINTQFVLWTLKVQSSQVSKDTKSDRQSFGKFIWNDSPGFFLFDVIIQSWKHRGGFQRFLQWQLHKTSITNWNKMIHCVFETITLNEKKIVLMSVTLRDLSLFANLQKFIYTVQLAAFFP